MRAYDVHAVESHWRARWEEAGCHRAPRQPTGPKYYVFDSTPFPNGSLHFGHVRTYTLGDVSARFQRLQGKCVLYHTGFDAFGLPNEMAAAEAGMTPHVYTNGCIGSMTRQLKQLGISYDWSWVFNTCDPDSYRWTQWLFLELWDAGLVERRGATLDWCPRCETTLARLQIEDGGCWRCGQPPVARRMTQWFIGLSRYSRRLRLSLDSLEGWSEQAKAMLRACMGDGTDGTEADGFRVPDWLVSRQKTWGTPIPMIHCPHCGVVPVPRDALPVRLPVHSGYAEAAGPLCRCVPFVQAQCPLCHSQARRETDTLDCFFDDIWCYLLSLVRRGQVPGFCRENFDGWLPVDRFQSGFDIIRCFHLYRFLGSVLHDRGILSAAEPIRGFIGNGLVLAGGRKMSKHLGNAVSPEELLRVHGADVVRVAILWAGHPRQDVEWNSEVVTKAAALVDSSFRMVASCAAAVRETWGETADGASKAADRLHRQCVDAVGRVAEYIDGYRPNVALELLAEFRKRIDEFAVGRVPTGRLSDADRAVLAAALRDYVVALSPLAPYLAEECWRMLGGNALACMAGWPRRR